MEPFSGDKEGSTEDIAARKHSKLKSLKTRLFRRSKKTDAEANAKLSQSASDITAGKGLGSDEDLVSSQGTMGTRAFSHESIFLDDQVLTDAEPARVLSQENVHGKIKALQMKLQLQKMHFGPPPMVLPVRSPEELSGHLEDFPFHSSNDASREETLTTTSSQPTSPPISPVSKSAPTKTQLSAPFVPFSVPTISTTSAVELPLDFSSPAEFTPSLNTSAARHRLSIKPRNQRASTKKKPPAVTRSESPLHILKTTDQSEFVKDQEEQLVAQEGEAEEAEKEQGDDSQHLSLKSAEPSPVESEAAPKLSTQQEHETEVSQMVRVKPPRRVGTAPTKRPHSSFIESEIKQKREGDLETQVMSDKKTEVSPEQLSTLSSVVASRPSSAQQQLHGEEENTRGIERPPPGSGSVHLSFRTVQNQEEERPQLGSFGELLEQMEAMRKTTGEPEEKEKEDFKTMQLKGSPFAAERLKQEGSPSRGPAVLWDRKTSFKKAESAKNVPQETAAVESEETESTSKGSAILWDRKASLKKTESATPAKNVPAVTATAEAKEVELVDVAEEAKEEEGKTAFGVKLRSTSLSLKFRSETSTNRYSNLSDDQDDKRKRLETGDVLHRMPEKVPTNTGCALRPKDPAAYGGALPVKHSTLQAESPPAVSTEVQVTPANNQEAETAPRQPQSTPQASSSEVSWMRMAMAKTRSLQQLFTSRFPRDFTGLQTAAQPKNQTETTAGTQTQTVKVQKRAIQPSVDTVKEDVVQTISQEQVVKPSTVAMQQKKILVGSQMSKQPNESQSQTNTAQTPPQPAQSVPWITHSPLRSYSQKASTAQPSQGSPSHSFAQSYLSSVQQQQPLSWSNRGFQPATSLRSSAQTSEPAVTAVPAPDSFLNKESLSLLSRRTIWSGSVVDRAAFLEKRAEWTAPPSLKGGELRKPQTEVQTSGDTLVWAKPPAVSKDTTAEIRQAIKSAELSPIRVLEKPCEDKWLRKSVESSPSSSLTRPSALQPDSNQPSWMELAKRKSMAWSDKTMD
ncbi:CRACD-like protein [Kryptolebias marmoratus]|uniref:CRACD like n=1 Tax=Kryptolebias marmoratus TaxID=37003 RepID=A0A3Q2ZDR3_KRYMA|nr:CRACD-like protein [Kryptolebias marmoratus]XP_017265871.1 CRACD-like protein [Kryptolebias marmoratus]